MVGDFGENGIAGVLLREMIIIELPDSSVFPLWNGMSKELGLVLHYAKMRVF